MSFSHPLDKHPHFTRIDDPESGAVSYALKPIVAPFQKGGYFLAPSIAGDNNILWFRGSHPPLKKEQTLAAVSLDPDQPDYRWFDGALMSGNFMLNESGDGAWVPINDGIYFQPFTGSIEETWRLDKSFLQGRHLWRLVTDLTSSPDGRYFLLDSYIGNRWLISLVDRQTGEHIELRWFGRGHHHTIYSRHDPELFMVSHSHWLDPYTGFKNEMDIRIWLMNTKLTRYEPLDSRLWFGQNSKTCHEWWTPEGKVQYCDYDQGIVEIDPDTKQSEIIWPRPCIHGMCDPTNRYLVGDVNCYSWNDKKPCSVWFLDRETGQEKAIISRMPEQPYDWRDFRAYHIDPHPHFSADGSMVIYTTVHDGRATVAVSPVAGNLVQ